MLKLSEKGGDWRVLAAQLAMNPLTTCSTWMRAGQTTPEAKGGRSKKLIEKQIEMLCGKVEKDPSLTLQQLAEKVQQLMGIPPSKSAVHSYLTGRLTTLKKPT